MKTTLKPLALAFALAAPAPAMAAGLGEETVPADEAELTRSITGMLADAVRAGYDANGVARRDAHAKAHGCVKAQVDVNPALAPELAVGVFQPGRSYPALVRYSNGSGRSQDDADGDGRGMAIKLLGVEGDKLLDDERDAKTQDILMINHPVFFVRNAADYVEFTRATSEDGNPLSFFFPGLNPFNWRTHELGIVRAIQGKKMANPLHSPYWSMTPVKYGATAAKIMVKPCRAYAEPRSVPQGRPDYLREAMAAQLATTDACFELLVQLQTNARTMPIEDPTIEWSERASPYRKVATVTIPRQSFDSAEQQERCENLSFTPWHSLPDHRPLGGINRIRKDVYQTISKVRHELNGARREEPTE